MASTKPTNNSINSSDKWRFTLYNTILLLILFNPWTYKITNTLLSGLVGNIASKDGCPTLLGFFIHVIVFTLILRFLMDLHI
jgi:hypothetical protein